MVVGVWEGDDGRDGLMEASQGKSDRKLSQQHAALRAHRRREGGEENRESKRDHLGFQQPVIACCAVGRPG